VEFSRRRLPLFDHSSEPQSDATHSWIGQLTTAAAHLWATPDDHLISLCHVDAMTLGIEI
jgi:hypothetical protein